LAQPRGALRRWTKGFEIDLESPFTDASGAIDLAAHGAKLNLLTGREKQFSFWANVVPSPPKSPLSEGIFELGEEGLGGEGRGCLPKMRIAAYGVVQKAREPLTRLTKDGR
jgi:hypothetical protein